MIIYVFALKLCKPCKPLLPGYMTPAGNCYKDLWSTTLVIGVPIKSTCNSPLTANHLQFSTHISPFFITLPQ